MKEKQCSERHFYSGLKTVFGIFTSPKKVGLLFTGVLYIAMGACALQDQTNRTSYLQTNQFTANRNLWVHNKLTRNRNVLKHSLANRQQWWQSKLCFHSKRILLSGTRFLTALMPLHSFSFLAAWNNERRLSYLSLLSTYCWLICSSHHYKCNKWSVWSWGPSKTGSNMLQS